LRRSKTLCRTNDSFSDFPENTGAGFKIKNPILRHDLESKQNVVKIFTVYINQKDQKVFSEVKNGFVEPTQKRFAKPISSMISTSWSFCL
jgi:hypothetical protein